MALRSVTEVPFTKQPATAAYKFVASLLKLGDDVNAIPDNEGLLENTTERDAWGTPLHGAAGNGHTESVRFLLEKSARRDVRDPNGLTPVEVAHLRGHTECAALLV